MNPRSMSDPLLRDAPVLRTRDRVEEAVRRLLDSGLPALPVADDDGHYRGIFGEREFMQALFPGYLGELQHAGFVPRSLEHALEKRSACRADPVERYINTEHIDVGTDFSDAQLAETFLHHRVLLVPVLDHTRVTGVITRADFFRALAERVLDTG
jgi:CBS domain-containing protein